MKNIIKFETLRGRFNLKKILLISLVVIGVTLILLNNFSHANFTSRNSVPFANGKINYKHPDFKIVNMYVKSSDGYTEVNTMPSGDEYVINSSKSYCNKGFTEEKDSKAVLKTVSGNHVMNNLTKNDRCTLYFDSLPILSNSWFSKQGTENAITKPDVESITTLDKISIPENAKSWDASEKGDGSVIAYYLDANSNGKYELYIAGDGSLFAPKNSSYLFSDSSNSKYFNNVIQMDLSKLDTKNVTNMSNMFRDMSNLTNLDVSNFNTSKVVTMGHMFSSMDSLIRLDLSNFDTSNVTNMSNMFYIMKSLISLNVSSFDTSKVYNMNYMFYYIPNLINLDVSNFDTSNVTYMRYMFSSLSSLTSLDLSNFVTSNVINMQNMFYNTDNLTSLNISNFDTSNVTDMSHMFNSMNSLTSLNISNFDTSKVTDMSSMFCGLSSLTSLDLSSFNTSNVTNMEWMFAYTNNLINLDLSSFNFNRVTSYENMFYNNISKLNSIKVKDATAKTFIEARLADVSKTGVTVTPIS